jgi:hypothetical protein
MMDPLVLWISIAACMVLECWQDSKKLIIYAEGNMGNLHEILEMEVP